MFSHKIAVTAAVLALGLGSAALSQASAQSYYDDDYARPAPQFDPLGAAGEVAGEALAIPGEVLGGPRAYYRDPYYGRRGYYGGVDSNSGYSATSPRDEQRNGNVDNN